MKHDIGITTSWEGLALFLDFIIRLAIDDEDAFLNGHSASSIVIEMKTSEGTITLALAVVEGSGVKSLTIRSGALRTSIDVSHFALSNQGVYDTDSGMEYQAGTKDWWVHSDEFLGDLIEARIIRTWDE